MRDGPARAGVVDDVFCFGVLAACEADSERDGVDRSIEVELSAIEGSSMSMLTSSLEVGTRGAGGGGSEVGKAGYTDVPTVGGGCAGGDRITPGLRGMNTSVGELTDVVETSSPSGRWDVVVSPIVDGIVSSPTVAAAIDASMGS